jgi:hypothetical protein
VYLAAYCPPRDAGSYLLGTALAMLLAAAFEEGDSLAVSSGAALFVTCTTS